MKNKIFKMKPIRLAVLLAGIGMTQSSFAIDLVAIDGQWSPDGGVTQIPMWGFVREAVSPAPPVDCISLPTWTVGPQLTDVDLVAGNLTINLRNCLSESVSIIIPGQPATFAPQTVPHTDTAGRISDRIRAFTHEALPGGTASYTWTGVKNGTYLYQSGSHPAKQVQMGLYGALTVGGYADVHDEVTLLYSEIDPVLHSTAKAATPLDYYPRHFLINGSESQSFPTAGDTNHPTLLRMLNAGLDFHVPTLSSGHMSLVAEDGHLYPFAKQQYSVTLSAGKTVDALWHPDSAGDYVIYDRRRHGMDATLTVAAGAGQPIANDDSYGMGEDGVLTVAAIGVLGNDTDALSVALTVPPASANLVSSTSSGSLALLADGSFTYTPTADFNGTDSFTYRANDGTVDSNVASVSITVTPVNDVPVASNDAYGVIADTLLSVAVPGVLGNDNDLDGDPLTAVLDTGPLLGGLTLNADGSFDYDPSAGVAAVAGDITSFTYMANDGVVNSNIVTVMININAAVNNAPVAAEDTFEVLRNSLANNLDLTANDSDADGNLKDVLGNVTNGDPASGSITITTGTTTTRGGTVNVITNGVNYVPKRNFRGTDTFSYTVTDLDGAVSNEVTVRVNVVRP